MTPVPIPRKNTPASMDLEREGGRRRPVVWPKGEGRLRLLSEDGLERGSRRRGGW